MFAAVALISFKFMNFLTFSRISKEFKRGNQVSFWPKCESYGAVAILTVTSELLYLPIWSNHSARFAQPTVAACLPHNNLNVYLI